MSMLTVQSLQRAFEAGDRLRPRAALPVKRSNLANDAGAIDMAARSLVNVDELTVMIHRVGPIALEREQVGETLLNTRSPSLEPACFREDLEDTPVMPNRVVCRIHRVGGIARAPSALARFSRRPPSVRRCTDGARYRR